MSQPASSPPHHDAILWALPFTHLAWERTPPAVQDYLKSQQQQIAQLQTQLAQFQSQLEQLQQHVETLQERLATTSQTSSKPPSSESPVTKPKRQRKTSTGRRVGQKGHRGRGPTFLRPTEVHLIEPGPCPWGQGTLVSRTPYYTHQVIELPPIEMDIHHGILPPGHCQGCGRQLKAQVPSHHQAGYGTDSEQGNRWGERTVSLRHTCRQLGQSTFGVLVDAVTSLFQGRQPDLAWLD